MLFLIATIFVLYTLLLVLLRQGVARIQSKKSIPDAQQIRALSVVVPFRNEAANLGGLINDLKSQSYPPFSYEVVLVDDHSTDGSYELLQRVTQGDARFRLMRLGAGEQGKKAALTEAIRVGKGEIILTTDADCRLPETWCRTMNTAFEDPAIKMCLAAVRLRGESTFFHRLLALEFVSVVAVTMATAGWGRPTLASGANLAFRKDAFYAVEGYFDERTLASGDDQFLMEKIVQRFAHAVVYLPNAGALVSTRAAENAGSFLQQRLRWAGKWTRLQPRTRAFAVFVFLFHLAAVISIPTALAVKGALILIAPLWLLKILGEWALLAPVARLTKTRWNWVAFVCWQLIYPFYAIAVGLFSRRNQFDWKDRAWQNQV